MLKLKTRHFLTGEELQADELTKLLEFAEKLRLERGDGIKRTDLSGKNAVLLFEKPSLRTHVSFSLGFQELGGHVVESFSFQRKREEPEDVARVLEGYAHAVIVRTFEHQILEKMASRSGVPIINALSDSHHPCQVLADLLTLKQQFRNVEGLKLAYIGDGNNMLHSLMLLAPYLGVHLSYACPQGYEPNGFILKKAKARAKEGKGSITACADPAKAVEGAQALYTDVWTSMGFEKEQADREAAFEGFQLNEELHSKAAPGAIVMHCMPMVRGKEISEGMVDHANSVLFRQSENRLHVQKALLLALLAKAE